MDDNYRSLVKGIIKEFIERNMDAEIYNVPNLTDRIFKYFDLDEFIENTEANIESIIENEMNLGGY